LVFLLEHQGNSMDWAAAVSKRLSREEWSTGNQLEVDDASLQ
jgi:hypothetical protein